jgi:hypothetical protein
MKTICPQESGTPQENRSTSGSLSVPDPDDVSELELELELDAALSVEVVPPGSLSVPDPEEEPGCVLEGESSSDGQPAKRRGTATHKDTRRRR